MIKPVLQDDAFLADVMATSEELSHAMRLWWLGQSGFLLQYRGRHLLFDPYLSDSLTRKYARTDKPHVRMTERVVAPERLDFVDLVTSSHNHTDHLDDETLGPLSKAAEERRRLVGASILLPDANEAFATQRLKRALSHGMFIFTIDAWERLELSNFEFTAIPAAHDQLTVDEHGRHVYLGYAVKVGPHVVYHSGDTVVYDGLAEGLRPFNVDVAILPINGKVGNMGGVDAARLAKEIGAKLVIPCHYEMFEFNTESPDEFVRECKRLNQPYRVLRAGERFTYGG